MKRVVSGIVWLAFFAFAGFIAAAHVPRLGAHGAIVGLAGGATVFLVATLLGWLPGVRQSRKPSWGLAQAFWLVAGFMIMQLVGALACAFAIRAIVWLAVHAGHPAPPPHDSVLATVVAGYLTSALWSFWYIGRLGAKRVRDGAATGIAWRRAGGGAYATAVLFAALIIVMVVILVHVFPPNMAAVRNMPSAKVFGAPGWPAAILVLLAVCLAPPVEEYVFRGGVFAALASRVSPLWAGVITTAVFMAVHAPEKIYYPAGFIDVGLMAAAAAWMRVKFGSIRPGILLHVLYNAGLLFAAGTLA
jgi:membrane protease YdiL (CAAX protease family)